jgi:putative transposase
LKRFAGLYGARILGYCLMTNHVHLVAIPSGHLSLAKLMREVNARYSHYRNAIEQRSGHLWQCRYYSCVFDHARLGSVMRYVELNPVRANIAKMADQYAWSSAIAHLGGPDPMRLLDLAGWDWTPDDWAGILRSGAEETAAIREATYGGRPWGADEFVARLEADTGIRLTKGTGGRPRKARAGDAAA